MANWRTRDEYRQISETNLQREADDVGSELMREFDEVLEGGVNPTTLAKARVATKALHVINEKVKSRKDAEELETALGSQPVLSLEEQQLLELIKQNPHAVQILKALIPLGAAAQSGFRQQVDGLAAGRLMMDPSRGTVFEVTRPALVQGNTGTARVPHQGAGDQGVTPDPVQTASQPGHPVQQTPTPVTQADAPAPAQATGGIGRKVLNRNRNTN